MRCMACAAVVALLGVAPGCTSNSGNAQTGAAATGVGQATRAATNSASTLVVVGADTLVFDSRRWLPMENEAEFAENFEDRQKGPRHVFGRVVTVFKLPMTDDRRIGTQIAPGEWLEFFVAHQGAVTVQYRLDRGHYWLLSRETLRPSPFLQDRLSPGRHLDAPTLNQLRFDIQREVDDTRFLLREGVHSVGGGT